MAPISYLPNTAEPALGQPVFVSARDLPVRAGCYAEYIAVPARAAHPLPGMKRKIARSCRLDGRSSSKHGVAFS